MTRLATLLAGSAAGLLLAAGAAQAGACSGEIMALQKKMEGMPTAVSATPTAPSANSGPAPLPAPNAPVPEAGATLGAPPSNDAGGTQDQAHAVPNGSGEAGATPGIDPQPNAGGGTLAQTPEPQPAPTEPMDADAADASQLNTAAGTDTTGTATTGSDAAAQSLARARALDQAGNESQCMDAVNQAKSQLAR